MTRSAPGLAVPSPSFCATPTGGRLATTYDLAFSGPHTRRIFSGIGFRTCDPPVSRPYCTAQKESRKRVFKNWSAVDDLVSKHQEPLLSRSFTSAPRNASPSPTS
ncbi:hypothetical protein AVEN_55094-1 [Araneus ventricosus]|uniref:Uncharacterized protein n=1 Tax=Araneus ventricosus TaxID=182803 RepID=A0A4Y2R9I4_ARAVE|nr:hypothetical protein AVEN_55094-1 [Araneus ventricosus]